jgi:hypothetical protein
MGDSLWRRTPPLFVSGSRAVANDPVGVNAPQAEEQNPGLPSLVLEIRARLGAQASPEQVAAEVRAAGYPNTSDEDVRQLWDEGHLPTK